ncbi:MAG: hypothetical protein ABI597_13720 [Gammaproteobacteria bacterium]
MIQPIIQDSSRVAKEIAIYWHIKDIQNVRPDLSANEACIVLHHLKKNHDASIGINWDVIDYVADILYPAIQRGVFNMLKKIYVRCKALLQDKFSQKMMAHYLNIKNHKSCAIYTNKQVKA